MDSFKEVSVDILAYLRQGPKRAVAVKAIRPFVVETQFEDGVTTQYDMSGALHGMLADLRDYSLFEKVYLDDTNSIAWDTPKGHIDTSKDTAYLFGTRV